MKLVNRWAFLGVSAVVLIAAASFHTATRRAVPAAAPSEEIIFRGDPSVRAVAARIAAKEQVVHELIAGGITLFRAAAAFRALSAQGPQPQVPIRIAYPQAASDDEAYCRCVIAYAGTEAPADQSDLLMSKLTAELSDRIRTGTLHIMDAAMDAEQAANAASPPTH